MEAPNCEGISFVQKCVLRRSTLPILPCDCNLCDWYIWSSGYNRCFWVLIQYLEVNPGLKFSFEEIAHLEGIPIEEVTRIYESAISKLRQESPGIVRSMDSNA
jgi:hypothetical protein